MWLMLPSLQAAPVKIVQQVQRWILIEYIDPLLGKKQFRDRSQDHQSVKLQAPD